jgi:ribosomal protein S18 acetylase RimI-like enzyme
MNCSASARIGKLQFDSEIRFMPLDEIVDVREALPGDAECTRALVDRAGSTLRAVYRPTPELMRSSEARAAARRQLVAERNGEIVGAISYEKCGDRLHLQSLAVDPTSQRQGIARMLVAHCVKLARSLGVSRLSLYTVVETGNVSIFERLGFHVVSTEPADGLEAVTAATVTEAYMEMSTDTRSLPVAQSAPPRVRGAP